MMYAVYTCESLIIPMVSPQAEVEKRNLLLKSITDPIGISATPPFAQDIKSNAMHGQVRSSSKKKKRNDRYDKVHQDKSDDQRCKKYGHAYAFWASLSV
jgi:hypothetical protein